MITINVPVEDFKEKWELYRSEDETYFNISDGQVAVVKYEDEFYFVLELKNEKIRTDKRW